MTRSEGGIVSSSLKSQTDLDNMKMKKDYLSLLKDPRWQKKRLEIMQRDNFTCQHCGCRDKTLHVHHLTYDKCKKPWEYNNSNLLTLCESCHKYESEAYAESYNSFIRLRNTFLSKGLSLELLDSIITQIDETVNNEIFPEEIIKVIQIGIFGTQNISDVFAARKIGIDLRDFVKEVYPLLLEEYNNTPVEVHHD